MGVTIEYLQQVKKELKNDDLAVAEFSGLGTETKRCRAALLTLETILREKKETHGRGN